MLFLFVILQFDITVEANWVATRDMVIKTANWVFGLNDLLPSSLVKIQYFQEK